MTQIRIILFRTFMQQSCLGQLVGLDFVLVQQHIFLQSSLSVKSYQGRVELVTRPGSGAVPDGHHVDDFGLALNLDLLDLDLVGPHHQDHRVV